MGAGSVIQSSVHSGVLLMIEMVVITNTICGTSTSLQVAGIIRVVGVYRDFTQADVLDYLIRRSTYDQLYDSGSENHDDATI